MERNKIKYIFHPRGRGEAASPLRGKIFLALGHLFLLALTASQTIAPASAQSGGGYDLTWNVIAGGGGMFSTSGTYSLGGAIGQADAGTMSGGAYAFNGGFRVDFLGNHIELPLIMRSN